MQKAPEFPEKENVTKKEFDKLKLIVDADHDKLPSFVNRQEFNEVIARFDKKLTENTEKLTDLRVGTEQMYRSINNDVQVIAGKIIEKMEQHLTRISTKAKQEPSDGHGN